MVKQWLICERCGKKDKTDGFHIGTKTNMKCKDCEREHSNGYATMCRECCPTGHATRFPEWEN